MVVDARRRRRHHPAPRARQVPGVLRRRLRRLDRRRPAARRLLRRQPLLALDLLRQPAGRRGRARRDRRRVPRAREHVRHEMDYLGAAPARGALCVDRPLHEPRRHDVGVGLAADRRADRRSASCSSPAFVLVERRASEPILPLSLFRNHTFAVTSAVGFIVGFALFGAVTYLPLYLQVTKGSSPTVSGLQLTPLMAGVLITSIVERPADHAHRALPLLPDRRHRADDRRDVPALAARRRHEHVGSRRSTRWCSASGSAW